MTGREKTDGADRRPLGRLRNLLGHLLRQCLGQGGSVGIAVGEIRHEASSTSLPLRITTVSAAGADTGIDS